MKTSLKVVPAWTLSKEERDAFLDKKPCFKMTTAEMKVWVSRKPDAKPVRASKAQWDAALTHMQKVTK